MKPIGMASRESGVSIETIRYYEREGVVPAAERAGNGRRLYAEDDIARLRFVKRCRSLGFPINDIKHLQDLAFSAGNNCREAARIGTRNLIAVRRKISELTRMESALQQLVEACAEGPEECPMLNWFSLELSDEDPSSTPS